MLQKELKRRAAGMGANAVLDASFGLKTSEVRRNGVAVDPKFYGLKQEQTVVGTAIKYTNPDCMR
ncbi:MAG TPA: hypothetical protein VM099_15050 [Gemmatimonadaceae bacterium]|nr:hypothetical protein [Gemmatimonadaceae bacterium]